jgi:hypothetical protein
MTNQLKTEIPAFWQVLNLRLVDCNSPIWWNLKNEPVNILPKGQLVLIDCQIRQFEKKLEPKLLLGLRDGENFSLLTMGLRTISALSVIEPLCFAPSSLLQSKITLHHEFRLVTTNVFIQFVIECGGKSLNIPLSSVVVWRQFCFHRLGQLQKKLNYPSIELSVLKQLEAEISNSDEEF